MRHLFSLLLLGITFQTFAQSVSNLQSQQLMFRRQDKVKLYKNTFKASEILGGGVFGPAQADEITTLFSPPICTGNINELLGKVYSTGKFSNTRDLLNLSLDEPMPILDSLNFAFYRSFSFLNVLDKKFEGDPLEIRYQAFKKGFKNAANNSERRKLLYDDDSNKPFRLALEDSRYSSFQKTINFNLTTRYTSDVKFGVTAKIAEELQNNYGLNASIGAAIQDIVSKYVEVTNATYDEIKLRSEYVTKVGQVIFGCNSDRSILAKYKEDGFTPHLKNFLDDPTAAIMMGV